MTEFINNKLLLVAAPHFVHTYFSRFSVPEITKYFVRDSIVIIELFLNFNKDRVNQDIVSQS